MKYLSEFSGLNFTGVVRRWRQNFMKRMALSSDYNTSVEIEKVAGNYTSEISVLTFELSKTMRLIEELADRIDEMERKR
ncbi:hypothetical protein LCGC14_2619750 [marine sediment metagenome]|uniref:Uncharacterized protein n=1 Tax=marine sediment metagenome TaxID=412755 RepID=A0A0F9CEE4_9ZZZZ